MRLSSQTRSPGRDAACDKGAGATSGGRIAQGMGDPLIDAVVSQVYREPMHGYQSARSEPARKGPPVDFLFAAGKDPKLPDEVFDRLLWGGLFVYVDHDEKKVRRFAQDYDARRGFILETGPTRLWLGRLWLRLPGLARRVHYFAARKIKLIQPGEFTDRFTYNVELMPRRDAEHGYVVCKQVPSHADVACRLHHRFPDADDAEIDSRTRKLVGSVFPTFLTREAAILKILQTELPEDYRQKVPKPMGVKKDGQGFVSRLAMNWMRTGGPRLSQIDFAGQSAKLLSVLHHSAQVMHLDLRLDNFVLTPDGVGFVDFGSSARIGEDLAQSPLLTSLFGEMMRTSKIQRMLGRMLDNGQVTNRSFTCVHQKADPAIDTFYLALQINRPTHNPQFAHLIDYQPGSLEAQAVSSLTAAVLRPKQEAKSAFTSADDILRGIERIRRRLIQDNPGPAPA